MSAGHDPRANQKQRTRAAIVEAASGLLAQGGAPTVAEAAAAAKVSRATAYRYFPTPEALMVEVAGITPAFAELELLVAGLDDGDSEARLALFVRRINELTFAEEPRMRMALRVYLDTWFANQGMDDGSTPIREGRRMRLLERVLDQLRAKLDRGQWRRLQAALALTVGTEPMVIMKDVCRLGDREAQQVLLWAALALLRAGADEVRASAAG